MDRVMIPEKRVHVSRCLRMKGFWQRCRRDLSEPAVLHACRGKSVAFMACTNCAGSGDRSGHRTRGHLSLPRGGWPGLHVCTQVKRHHCTVHSAPSLVLHQMLCSFLTGTHQQNVQVKAASCRFVGLVGVDFSCKSYYSLSFLIGNCKV